MVLSPDQAKAVQQLYRWFKEGKEQTITLGGYAGTGKTTLASVLRWVLNERHADLSVAFCAFTGKATHVLRQRLEAANMLLPQDTCSTLHALLYVPYVAKDGSILGWHRAKEVEANLIIVDEASMVTEDLWRDLVSLNVPIIAIGDHGQLPPVGGSFNLVQEPKIRLEQIHRQAAGNPILTLAQEARTTGRIEPGIYGKGIEKLSYANDDGDRIREITEDLLSSKKDVLILCGRNTTRQKLNTAARATLGFETGEPEGGDKVVCLKNSYAVAGEPLYNGMIGTIETLSEEGAHWYDATISFPGEEREFSGIISRHQFGKDAVLDKFEGISPKQIGERFDFGYALTVHKAQGSQADTVLLFEERFQKMSDDDWKRWLYTAVTRAKKKLYIVGE
jgi:exodeoxyribonuclease-5